MPVFKIHHITSYSYERPVVESVNEVKIFPYRYNDQEVLQHDLTITGNPDVMVYEDYFGNKSGVFNLVQPHTEMVIDSKLIVRTVYGNQIKINYHSGFSELEGEIANNVQLIDLSAPDQIKSNELIREMIGKLYSEEKSVAATVEAFSEYIYKYFKYIKGITNVETTVDDILQFKSGVCQDFSHLLLQMLRMAGIPSRYVSGYICPDRNGLRGEGATHAWVDVWIPGYGWAGIDPTNNIWVTNNHVVLSVGRSFKDCTPVKGTFKGMAKQALSVYVSVGYEDGHVFEEKNNVNLTVEASYQSEDLIISVNGRQQQQQQQ